MRLDTRPSLTAAICLLALLVAGTAGAQGEVVARLTDYDGNIDVIRRGIPLAIYPELPLRSGDLINTRDGRAALVFGDKSELRLKPQTRLAVSESEGRRDIEVFFGRLWASIKRMQTRTTRFRTGGTIAAVSGTVIEYMATPQGDVRTGCVEGLLLVSSQLPSGATESVDVATGQQTTVRLGEAPTQPQPFTAGDIFEGAPQVPMPAVPIAPAVAPAAVAAAAVAPRSAPTTSVPVPVPVPARPLATPTPRPSLPPVIAPRRPLAQPIEPAAAGQQLAREAEFQEGPAALTQGAYAVQLINALGLTQELPPNATQRDAIGYLIRLNIRPCEERVRPLISPLVPFGSTGDLFVLDSGSGHILRVDEDGDLTIARFADDVRAISGSPDVNYRHMGIAFDGQGGMFFNEDRSASVFRLDATEELTVLADPARFRTTLGRPVKPLGITFSGNGLLYVSDGTPGHPGIVKVDPGNGVVTDHGKMPDLGDSMVSAGIIGGQGNSLFILTHGGRDGVYAVAPDGRMGRLAADTFEELDGFMTRDGKGQLVIADSGSGHIYRMLPDGSVQIYLSQEELRSITGDRVLLEGGIAFDADGNFFVTDAQSDSILKIDPDGDGKVWLEADKVEKVTGRRPSLDGGIAFQYLFEKEGGWSSEREITLEDLLCLVGIDPSDPDAPLALPIEDVIDRILEQYAELFWVQSRRKPSVSPFAP